MTYSPSSAALPAPTTLTRRISIFAHALLFVLGFSAVFVVVWGGAATLFGRLLYDARPVLSKIGGVIVIVLGLTVLGVIHIPLLYRDTRPQWSKRGTGLWSSALLGVFFAAGWTPCIGTTLGAILTLGMSGQATGQAMLLSSGYALGLGAPFLALGLMVDHATHVVRRLGRHMRTIEIASGMLLIGMGILLLTDQLFQIAIWAQRNQLYVDVGLGGSDTPTYLVAALAGLLSFLSPCVLPLVPAYLGYLGGRSIEGVPLVNSGSSLGQ